MSGGKSYTPPAPTLELEAQNAALQTQVDELSTELEEFKGLFRAVNRFWGGVIGVVLCLFLINYLSAPETRWFMPSMPKYEGSKCLWFLDRNGKVCAVWNIYSTLASPTVLDTAGYADACTKAGRTIMHRSFHDGPVPNLWVNTWACE